MSRKTIAKSILYELDYWKIGKEKKKLIREMCNALLDDRILVNSNIKTNGDRIRRMSDDELSKVIMCPFEYIDGFVCQNSNCRECCEEWLKQEADE